MVLSTTLFNRWKEVYPDSRLTVIVRNGNQALLENHPSVDEVWVWKKKLSKFSSWWNILLRIREKDFDAVFCLQRFFLTGLWTALSESSYKSGFRSNPLSFTFSKKPEHELAAGKISGHHEIERNQRLIEDFVGHKVSKPSLRPVEAEMESVKEYLKEAFICLAPSSVWKTKRFPAVKWIDFLNSIEHKSLRVYLLGSKEDREFCERIKQSVESEVRLINLAGKLNLMQSAALISKAKMTFSNDSAPLHIASAMNAPVCAIFCSTIPQFGFGPLSDTQFIVEVSESLYCRPCGIHGKAQCPEKHFKCALDIDNQKLLDVLKQSV